jgi:hypothetical protein
VPDVHLSLIWDRVNSNEDFGRVLVGSNPVRCADHAFYGRDMARERNRQDPGQSISFLVSDRDGLPQMTSQTYM